GGSAPSRGHRHARRGAPLLALLLATGALLLACGQPGAITTSPAHAPATTGTTPAGHTAADAPAPVRSPARTRPLPSPPPARVLVEVERYLKGDRPEQRLLLAVEGGVVGPDCAAPIRTDAWHPRDGYVLDGRLVVFLRRPAEPLPTLEGAPLWPEVRRYGVGSDELVTVRRDDRFPPRTIPLEHP